MRDAPATLDYIADAARRHDTAVAAAFRRALGIGKRKRRSRRRRSGRGRRPDRPSRREMDECRRQTYGVTWHGE